MKHSLHDAVGSADDRLEGGEIERLKGVILAGRAERFRQKNQVETFD